MGSISLVVGYIAAAGAMFQLLKRVNDGDELNFIFALMWPLTLFGLLYYALFRPIGYPYKSGQVVPESLTLWKRATPRTSNEDMIMGKDNDQNVEDMAAFIETLASRPDAPLPHELTFCNKLTGISRTYPAGTMFPSALVDDWKRGYFVSKETVEDTEA